MGSQVTRCLEIQQKPCEKQIQTPLCLKGPSWFLGQWMIQPPSRLTPAMSHRIFPLLKNGTRRPSAVMWRRPALWAYGGRKRIRSQCRGPRVLGKDKVSNEKRALFRVYTMGTHVFFWFFKWVKKPKDRAYSKTFIFHGFWGPKVGDCCNHYAGIIMNYCKDPY